MPNEPEKNPISGNKPIIHTHQLPIDLAANKVIVKPANDNSKMSIQSTFRSIQQPPQMRVVRMPSTQIIQTHVMPQTMLKPSMPGRSITVSKSPATYLPRVTATLNSMKGTQQLRTPTPPSSVAGISSAFVRSITPRTSSPNAVLTQGTTAWVSGPSSMQVQMPQQIIRSAIPQNRTITANIFSQSGQQQNPTISVSTSSSGTSGQPTYVATVLPQRPQTGGATIVYTSQPQQPFIQGQIQRMGVATGAANARTIRPMQRIPPNTIRVNTSSLSIRQNVPALAPTTVLASQNRNSTGLPPSGTISNTIPARIFQVQSQQSTGGSQVIGQANQKILSANVMLPIIVNNRMTHTVKSPMTPGIIAHVSKLTSGTVSSDGTIISNSQTNTMSSISNTMVATIQPNQSIQSQVSQVGNQQTIYTTQSPQQVSAITNQGGSQIITMSQQQQQQLINSQQQANLHQSGNVQTVLPLSVGSRNVPIKTITVSASNSVTMDSNIHRNLTSNAGNLQATTIMPIAKIVSQQQVINAQQNISSAQITGQGTPVYIHTRIPAVSTVASSVQSQVITVSSSNSTPTFSTGHQTATLYYEQASIPSSANVDNKTTSSSSANEGPSYSVTSGTNVRYTDKMIQSIITSNFQNQNAQNNSGIIQQHQQSTSNQQTVPIRFSPLVVESQSGTQTSHQIITMGSGNTVQQQQATSTEGATHMIVPILNQVPTSPRGPTRKANETTPVKAVKKPPKLKNYQQTESLQTRVPQRQQIATIAQIIHSVKQIEQKPQLQQPLQQQLHSTASSPKTTFSERGSPSQADDSSDRSTTISIPNSPRSEDEDLDAMIMSNQFNKISEDFMKFTNNKTPGKLGSGVKRDAADHHPNTPKSKKIKQ